jgi:hypothetical protein
MTRWRTTVLDNLQIGATAGGLLSEKHGGERREQTRDTMIMAAR